jgi:hypothetical protein
MKNWKTTVIGAAFAAVTFISTYQANGGNLADWKLWVIPALAAALGYVAKDAGVTGSLKILIASLCLLTLSACTVDWQKAAVAATNAAAPVVLEGINAKQPKNVQP